MAFATVVHFSQNEDVTCIHPHSVSADLRGSHRSWERRRHSHHSTSPYQPLFETCMPLDLCQPPISVASRPRHTLAGRVRSLDAALLNSTSDWLLFHNWQHHSAGLEVRYDKNGEMRHVQVAQGQGLLVSTFLLPHLTCTVVLIQHSATSRDQSVAHVGNVIETVLTLSEERLHSCSRTLHSSRNMASRRLLPSSTL
jgi:hypothetical protein